MTIDEAVRVMLDRAAAFETSALDMTVARQHELADRYTHLARAWREAAKLTADIDRT